MLFSQQWPIEKHCRRKPSVTDSLTARGRLCTVARNWHYVHQDRFSSALPWCFASDDISQNIDKYAMEKYRTMMNRIYLSFMIIHSASRIVTLNGQQTHLLLCVLVVNRIGKIDHSGLEVITEKSFSGRSLRGCELVSRWILCCSCVDSSTRKHHRLVMSAASPLWTVYVNMYLRQSFAVRTSWFNPVNSTWTLSPFRTLVTFNFAFGLGIIDIWHCSIFE